MSILDLRIYTYSRKVDWNNGNRHHRFYSDNENDAYARIVGLVGWEEAAKYDLFSITKLNKKIPL